MKKLFLTGALAAVMAFSSTAFAAVEENTNLQVTYNEETNVAAIETDLSTYEGQMTVIILNKETNAIVAEDIIYIDQAAAGADIFKNMGVLLPEGADKLPEGTYYVKVGGENVPQILVATFTISSGATGTDITFVWGDVNATGATDNNDAFDILLKMAGGADKVGNSEYAIGQIVKEGIVWGDINSTGATDNNDAFDILLKMAGGADKVGNSEYAIGQSVTITIPNAQ